MRSLIVACVLTLSVLPATATERTKPVELSDKQMDKVTAGFSFAAFLAQFLANYSASCPGCPLSASFSTSTSP